MVTTEEDRRDSLLFPSGIRVEVSTLLKKKWVPDYSRPVRRHRKRLIAKRWVKRYGYHMKEVESDPYWVNGTLICGPELFEKLKKEFTL